MSASGMMMNCEEYKEGIAADPSESFAGGAEHAAACQSCAAWKTQMQALDHVIAKALAIDVPTMNLPELPMIEDDNVVNLPFVGKSRKSTPVWLGIAASLALAAFIGLQFVGNEPAVDISLADEILAHLDHEPGALRVTNVAVSDNRLARVVDPSVGTIDRSVGLISYARTCVINGKKIPHLVLQGEKGPITLLLLPDEMIDAAVSLNGDGVDGVILPVGNGSIAIIGEREERIDEIQQRIIESVEWSI